MNSPCWRLARCPILLFCFFIFIGGTAGLPKGARRCAHLAKRRLWRHGLSRVPRALLARCQGARQGQCRGPRKEGWSSTTVVVLYVLLAAVTSSSVSNPVPCRLWQQSFIIAIALSSFSPSPSTSPLAFFHFLPLQKKIGYLHVMDGLGFGFHKLGEPMTLQEFREVLPKETVLVGNVGYTAETAEKAISAGDADAIAFGRPFITNPDLPERFANDWPMAEASEPSTWYTLDPSGPGANYSDFPPYQQ